jgi:hypothetical protein
MDRPITNGGPQEQTALAGTLRFKAQNDESAGLSLRSSSTSVLAQPPFGSREIVAQALSFKTPTASPAKVRFRGEQDRAYRFVFCVRHQLAASSREVVRHRCNNRLCVNPDHLELGDRRDNLEDDRRFRARGVDFDLL